MNWLHILLAFVASAVVASFTDWYFFGILFHERYGKTPGVWKKYRDKKDEIRSIAVSQAILSVTSLVFIAICTRLGWVSASSSLLAAIVVWVMIPVPLLAVNAIYIPMDRWIAVSHSLGWLARLVIAALCASWLP